MGPSLALCGTLPLKSFLCRQKLQPGSYRTPGAGIPGKKRQKIPAQAPLSYFPQGKTRKGCIPSVSPLFRITGHTAHLPKPSCGVSLFKSHARTPTGTCHASCRSIIFLYYGPRYSQAWLCLRAFFIPLPNRPSGFMKGRFARGIVVERHYTNKKALQSLKTKQ